MSFFFSLFFLSLEKKNSSIGNLYWFWKCCMLLITNTQNFSFILLSDQFKRNWDHVNTNSYFHRQENGDFEPLDITPLSSPPELPEVMKPQEPQTHDLNWGMGSWATGDYLTKPSHQPVGPLKSFYIWSLWNFFSFFFI